MFSKEESAKLKQLFWTSFGKSFPKKWLLYNTKIKGLVFKFVADTKVAMVCLDIEMNNTEIRNSYFERILSLKNILLNQYISNLIFDKDYQLENGKSICRIYIVFPQKFSVHNKDTWHDAFQFFIQNMEQFELFFYEYEDYIQI